ncbi:Type I restriction-modification system, DNA-methyltransferase subunit M / Type I restriction-modification system, specificity subunit S [hydrothermal vent metagenome]|uniref:Type I restriction-modification system, DNA-methyltransferase subunit M / Type I restriction-modification system, specificity subunit S n=1 Tax=hydrothermal vent metagenome TaxID=652676 RepID=A0A1W1BIG7_9ZZZZ
MINKDNFKALLLHLGFEERDNIFSKRFESGYSLMADFKKEELQYPELEGLKIHERQTCNFSSSENAVVFECVCKLLEKGIRYNGGSSVNDIITPLFDPNNLSDTNKINTLIKKNFLGKLPSDLSGFEEYKELISYVDMQDILDFSRKDFNKAFSLTPKKSIVIESK